MKRTICPIICLMFVTVGSEAQDSTVVSKLDTVLQNQQKMMEMQERIYKEVAYDEPLADKCAGIELNVARLLVSSGEDYFTLSGTVSFFSVSRSAELAFPVFYQNGSKRETETFGSSTYDVPLTLLNVDATYRQFLGKHQDGFYFSVGTRYTYIHGIQGTDYFLFTVNAEGPETTTRKLGAYFGLGYRYFTKSGFYWGASIVYGRYFSKNNVDIREVTFDDSKNIIDIEFLKFGFAF